MQSRFFLDGFAVGLAALLLIVLSLLYLWKRRLPKPRLRYSSIALLKGLPKSWRERWIKLPERLQYLALACFVVAFTDPRFLTSKQTAEPSNAEKGEKEGLHQVAVPTEGVAIYLVLDQSSSMRGPGAAYGYGPSGRMSKIELLKRVVSEFIQGESAVGLEGRWNDMLGLVAFSRVPHILVPLTLEHDILLKELSSLQPVKEPAQDGTAIGYAIFKTVNFISATKYFAQEQVKEGKPAYDIKSTILILVTDGIQAPNSQDLQNSLRNMSVADAAAYAKKEGVRIYIINVDPSIMDDPELAYDRKQLEAAAESTKGKFYVVDADNPLPKLFLEIDKLEKSRLPGQLEIQAEIKALQKSDEKSGKWTRISLYPYFIAAGLFAMLLSILLSTTLLRRVL